MAAWPQVTAPLLDSTPTIAEFVGCKGAGTAPCARVNYDFSTPTNLLRSKAKSTPRTERAINREARHLCDAGPMRVARSEGDQNVCPGNHHARCGGAKPPDEPRREEGHPCLFARHRVRVVRLLPLRFSGRHYRRAVFQPISRGDAQRVRAAGLCRGVPGAAVRRAGVRPPG